jgi:response regulator RpfG family c-di-GMP phosphodiesterase
MSIAAEEFTVKSKDDRAESLDRLNNLDIKTGDEIEHLYDTLRTTMAETVEQMEHIKEKGDQISKMQNGLITVLADMVESRDKNTGDHVKKTSDYTRLLLESMKKKGVYKNEVTDQYIDDVSNSAALHDIGKIKVPDSIFK